jgi:hypothetical protein
MQTSTTAPAGGAVSASRTVAGLTVGRAYTATVWVNPAASTGVTALTLGAAGVGASTPVPPGTGYQQLTYGFTATAASHTIVVGYTAATDVGSTLVWDDVSLTQDAWVETTVAASTVTDQVVRSQSGRIMRDILTDTASATAETSMYTFDAAGRLTLATLTNTTHTHTLSYGYGTTTGCVNNGAGKNGNRTAFADNLDGVVTSVAYCYDNADQLTGTDVTPNIGANGLSPVAGGDLTTSGPNPSLGYDAHGNTTRLADQ